ncbi:MAG: hypothetical protein JWM27_4122 [Gemmatimonadetes bacterium]|nr:hypothetical protein [Gemmatimonadota bacterium]
MQVYLKEEPVALEMREVDAEGLVEDEAGLVPVAFFVTGNQKPSFRALLPPETLVMLEEATQKPVMLGLLAEEPEDPAGEVRAMVGLSLSPGDMPDTLVVEDEDDDDEDSSEPWTSADADAWKSEGDDDREEGGGRTVLLAFAPLVRLARKFPNDFSEELADLLESALAGDTKPNLQARIDRMLGDL